MRSTLFGNHRWSQGNKLFGLKLRTEWTPNQYAIIGALFSFIPCAHPDLSTPNNADLPNPDNLLWNFVHFLYSTTSCPFNPLSSVEY